MAKPLTAPIAENLVIGDGFIVRFAAVDPTTGATVTGVKVTNVNIDGDTLGSSGPPDNTVVGPYLLVGGPDA